MTDLENRIEKIEQRNARVEQDKKWERSPVRIICIIVLTYSLVLLYQYLADTSSIFISSAIPVLGFFLSTLSIGFIRKLCDKIKSRKR